MAHDWWNLFGNCFDYFIIFSEPTSILRSSKKKETEEVKSYAHIEGCEWPFMNTKIELEAFQRNRKVWKNNNDYYYPIKSDYQRYSSKVHFSTLIENLRTNTTEKIGTFARESKKKIEKKICCTRPDKDIEDKETKLKTLTLTV